MAFHGEEDTLAVARTERNRSMEPSHELVPHRLHDDHRTSPPRPRDRRCRNKRLMKAFDDGPYVFWETPTSVLLSTPRWRGRHQADRRHNEPMNRVHPGVPTIHLDPALRLPARPGHAGPPSWSASSKPRHVSRVPSCQWRDRRGRLVDGARITWSSTAATRSRSG